MVAVGALCCSANSGIIIQQHGRVRTQLQRSPCPQVNPLETRMEGGGISGIRNSIKNEYILITFFGQASRKTFDSSLWVLLSLKEKAKFHGEIMLDQIKLSRGRVRFLASTEPSGAHEQLASCWGCSSSVNKRAQRAPAWDTGRDAVLYASLPRPAASQTHTETLTQTHSGGLAPDHFISAQTQLLDGPKKNS